MIKIVIKYLLFIIFSLFFCIRLQNELIKKQSSFYHNIEKVIKLSFFFLLIIASHLDDDADDDDCNTYLRITATLRLIITKYFYNVSIK